jgi:hypothetical protein
VLCVQVTLVGYDAEKVQRTGSVQSAESEPLPRGVLIQRFTSTQKALGSSIGRKP